MRKIVRKNEECCEVNDERSEEKLGKLCGK